MRVCVYVRMCVCMCVCVCVCVIMEGTRRSPPSSIGQTDMLLSGTEVQLHTPHMTMCVCLQDIVRVCVCVCRKAGYLSTVDVCVSSTCACLQAEP